MRDFRRLQVWEKSHPTNIAEGCGRNSPPDFARFLQIAMGSASETEYLVLLARDLKYIETNQYVPLTDEIVRVKKMLTSLLKSLKADSR